MNMINKHFQLIIVNIFLPKVLAYVMGYQKKHLTETVLEHPQHMFWLRNKNILILAHWIRISDILLLDRKSYLTHAILPRTSSNVIT